MVRELGWKQKQKVEVKLSRGKMIIKDWEK
jgi:hypothetical protein